MLLPSILFLCVAWLPGQDAPSRERAEARGLTQARGLAEPQEFSAETRSRLDAAVLRWHERGDFDGAVLVARAGSVWSKAYGKSVREWDCPNSVKTRFPIASITKQFTAVLVMRQVERGAIALDAAISDYLPWYPEEPGRSVTVRDLLTHTSGLPEPPVLHYMKPRSSEDTPRSIIERHCAGPPSFEPGSQFAYSNADYHVLGAILEAVSKKSFEQLLQDEILLPLGMEASGIANRDEILDRRAQDYVLQDGAWLRAPAYRWENWHAAGAMYSTVQDMHLWNAALSSQRLLTMESWETMLTPRTDVGSTGNYVACGVWVYPRALPDVDKSPIVIERRGGIGGFTTLNVILKDKPWWIILLANAYNEQIHQLPWGSSLPLDLLLILHDQEAQGPPQNQDSTKR